MYICSLPGTRPPPLCSARERSSSARPGWEDDSQEGAQGNSVVRGQGAVVRGGDFTLIIVLSGASQCYDRRSSQCCYCIISQCCKGADLYSARLGHPVFI